MARHLGEFVDDAVRRVVVCCFEKVFAEKGDAVVYRGRYVFSWFESVLATFFFFFFGEEEREKYRCQPH